MVVGRRRRINLINESFAKYVVNLKLIFHFILCVVETIKYNRKMFKVNLHHVSVK